jgi:hypothetical protein
MTEWTAHLLRSFADQAGTWFIGVVLALLGVFSGRLVESIKFALNRADLRAKYFEQLAVDLSSFVFAIDRITKVYYGPWVGDDGKRAIAEFYDESMNKLCSQEYVYLSWLQHYWNQRMVDAFVRTMDKVRAVDELLIELNAMADPRPRIGDLTKIYRELQTAAQALLLGATR